jgi:hypothetical protein
MPRVEIHRKRAPEHWVVGAAAFFEVVDALALELVDAG